MDQICNGKEAISLMLDQGFTHHIITFKTNQVYVEKQLISLPMMIDQAIDVVNDNDHVCFSA